jgi:hypothetical protein
MKLACNATLIPDVESDNRLIESWGKELEFYAHQDGLLFNDKNDIRRVLSTNGATSIARSGPAFLRRPCDPIASR